jgi:hypothetical protein
VIHVELRRFPHVVRVFNLTREEVDERVVKPWVAGVAVELDDRRWEPGRTRLAIYDGPEVPPEDRGLGRGWANVTRAGQEVTERLLDAARGSVENFKAELLTHARLTLEEVVALAGQSHPQARVSDRLDLAERAVWELLHEGRLRLAGPDGAPLDREQWAPALLNWETWTGGSLSVEARS